MLVGGLCRLTYGMLQYVGHCGVEGDEEHRGDGLRPGQVPADLPHSDRGGPMGGEPVDSATDGGEGDGLDRVSLGEVQRGAVARREQVILAPVAAAPERAHGMDDVCG